MRKQKDASEDVSGVSEDVVSAEANTEPKTDTGVSSLGERLQRYRKRSGLIGEQLAKKINDEYGEGTITRSIIANVENGRRKTPKFDEIVQLAHGLGITPLALICDLEQPFLSADMPVFQGITNYDVASRFLADLGGKLPESMGKVSKIYDTYSSYYDSIKSLLYKLNNFEESIQDGYKPDPEAYDTIALRYGATFFEVECRDEMADTERKRGELKALNVVIPQVEFDNFNTVYDRFLKASRIARDKRIITPETEQSYRKYLDAMASFNEESSWIQHRDEDEPF